MIIGGGASEDLPEGLSLGRGRALAAVAPDEVENVGIAVAARRVRKGYLVDRDGEIEPFVPVGVRAA